MLPPDWETYTGETLTLPCNTHEAIESTLIDAVHVLKGLVKPYTPEYRLWFIPLEWKFLMVQYGYRHSIRIKMLYGVPVIITADLKDIYLAHHVSRVYVRIKM